MDRVLELMDEKYDVVDKEDAKAYHRLLGKSTLNVSALHYEEDGQYEKY